MPSAQTNGIEVLDSNGLVQEFLFLTEKLNGGVPEERKRYLSEVLSRAPNLKVVNEIPLVVAIPVNHANIESVVQQVTGLHAANRLGQGPVAPRDETVVEHEPYLLLGVAQVSLDKLESSTSALNRVRNNNRIPLELGACIGYLQKNISLLAEGKKICALGSRVGNRGTPIIELVAVPSPHVQISFMIDENVVIKESPSGTFVGLSAQRIVF